METNGYFIGIMVLLIGFGATFLITVVINSNRAKQRELDAKALAKTDIGLYNQMMQDLSAARRQAYEAMLRKEAACNEVRMYEGMIETLQASIQAMESLLPGAAEQKLQQTTSIEIKTPVGMNTEQRQKLMSEIGQGAWKGVA